MDNIEKYIEITYDFSDFYGNRTIIRFLPTGISHYNIEIPIYDEYGAVIDWDMREPVYYGYYYDGIYRISGNKLTGGYTNGVGVEIEARKYYSKLEYNYSDILRRLQNGEFLEDIHLLKDYNIDRGYSSWKSDCEYKELPAQISILNIPSQIEEIGDDVFTALEINQLQLPNSLKRIGARAFSLMVDEEAPSRTSPSSLTIPNNVEYIGQEAFKGWNNLRTINLPNNFKLEEYTVLYKNSTEVVYDLNKNIFAVEKNKGDNLDAYGNQITTINGNKYNREFVKWALLMNRNVNNISENSLENGFIQVHINGGNNLQIPFYWGSTPSYGTNFSVDKIYDLKDKYSIIKFNIKVEELGNVEIWNWIFITDKYISGLTMPIKLHIGNKLYYVVDRLYLKDLGGNNG